VKDIRSALRQFLLDDPIVSGLVNGNRIFPVRLPQDETRVSVVYFAASETGDYHMQGDSGLGQTRIQVDSWAERPDQAVELANAVYDRLSGARATVTVGSDFVDIKGIFLANKRDLYDPIVKMTGVSRDYIIWYGASE